MADKQTRQLGDSDLHVSAVGLGCNNFGRPRTPTADLAGTRAVIDAAADSGVTFLDTAEMYLQPPGASETLMGAAMQGKRDKFILATKFGHSRITMPGSAEWGPKGGRTYIRNALDASLQRLQTSYVDLYQMHSPDPSVPISETLGALNELIDEGKVRAIGHTQFTATQTLEAEKAAQANDLQHFVSAQNEYNLLARSPEGDLFTQIKSAGLGFLPFYPLANGLLTGKYTEDHRPEGRLTTLKADGLDQVDWHQLGQYQQLCDEAGVSMLQGTFGWLLSQSFLSSVIAGATRPEQVTQNAEAGQHQLPAQLTTHIDALFSATE